MSPSSRKNKGSIKKKPHSRLTFVVMNPLGKMKNFTISRSFLVIAIAFLLIYIIATIFLINDYFAMIRTNSALLRQNEGLTRKMNQIKKDSYKSRQRVIFLESLLNRQAEEETDMEGSENPVASKEETSPEPVEPEGPGEAEKPEEPHVDVEEISFSRQGLQMTVSFKLLNAKKAKEPASGYVHIIAVDKNSQTPQYWTYPKVAIRNDMPVDYKKGLLFIINNFKTIRGEYFFDSEKDSPSQIKIVIYDRKGKLLLKRAFNTG